MRKLGIIQPGKIGDIIICLPIAKWYHNKGYQVIWPVDRNIINNFIGYVDYVDFIPVNFDCEQAKMACYQNNCNTIIDLSFTIPNANNMNSSNYLQQELFSFDEFKYHIADVPFEEKWNLDIIRNSSREKELFDSLYKNQNYVVVQENSSDRNRKVSWENTEKLRVDIEPFKSQSVFDWLTVLEKADQHILIASCFTNLLDQLNIVADKQYVLMKEGYDGKPLKDGHLRGMPRLRLKWIQI